MQTKALAFDFDGTLEESKQPITTEVADLLIRLLDHYLVMVISGEQFELLKEYLLDQLGAANLQNLHIFPQSGAQYYRYNGSEWELVYDNQLTVDEVDHICQIVQQHAQQLGLWIENPVGEIIENRGAQVTYSALGQQASIEQKREWDPDQQKRKALQDAIRPELPNMIVRIGGTTSIDISKIDKSYGVQQFIERNQLQPEEVTYYGDKLDAGGNDEPVKKLGIQCVSVANWQQTVKLLQ